MESTIDYSTYSLYELQQARRTIDETAYPARAAELDQRIEALLSQENSETSASNATEVRKVGVLFHGNTREFFSIWMVNLLLTIVTLGIYSAWAKVRTNRYFYGNTEIDGHRFSYLAEPLQILKGRIIAIVLFAAYFLVSSMNPALGALLVFVMLGFTPLLVVLSLRFNLKMTGYRNVRLGFRGSYGRAFVLFVLLPIASVFTLHLMMPWVLKKIDQFLVNEMTLGDRQFESNLDTGEYYAAALGAAFIAIGIFIIGIFMFGISLAPDPAAQGVSFATIGLMAIYLIAYAVSSSFYTARIRNHLFASTQIPGVAKFTSTVATMDLVMLRTINVLAIVCSLGLAIPWVKIRNARFFSAATSVTVMSGLESVAAGEQGSVGATAEEAATLFDVDVALG
ncbi:YjgN family protein [Alteromonas flava]|uniref:YjgN family protein n=1 Tax=Alteromonas flava TaxID=2048003 RepID=UPI000C286364|nr:YjgN family protein [Alteromonas flava]